MQQTFFFYDLETSGIRAKSNRVMQFGGQRTDLELNPIGEPVDILIKLSPDTLPDPEAILITGITPQQTIADGITEAAFCKQFISEIALPGTIFVGFNSIRFDDEFMRYLLWRNFYDPYEWQWKDGRSRWDILDVSRMTRALRPDGINWPFASDGKPTNRLGSLTSVNKLDHQNAHDALSDVRATIAVAKLIRDKQHKLFDYLLALRDKKAVSKFVSVNELFVYSSGKYSSEHEKTTLAGVIGERLDKQGVLVFDTRQDPSPFLKMTADQLADIWRWKEDKDALRLPVKTLKYNRCPAIAPLAVLDEASRGRLNIDVDSCQKHFQALQANSTFLGNLHKALDILDQTREQLGLVDTVEQPDEQLYSGFVADQDRRTSQKITQAPPAELTSFTSKLSDERLKALIPLYKARNYSDSLDDTERGAWEAYCSERLTSGGESSQLTKYFKRLSELSERSDLTKNELYLLEELKLYGESLL